MFNHDSVHLRKSLQAFRDRNGTSPPTYTPGWVSHLEVTALLNLLLRQREQWERYSWRAARPLGVTHPSSSRCSRAGRKLASARKGLHGHSCQGEGATELLYAKQKSLN